MPGAFAPVAPKLLGGLTMNNRITLSAYSTLLLFAALSLSPGNAAAQGAKSVAGTYTIVSVAQFGANPRGQMILGRDGHSGLVSGKVPSAACTPAEGTLHLPREGPQAPRRRYAGRTLWRYVRQVRASASCLAPGA